MKKTDARSIKIIDLIQKIQNNEFVLPEIQREFVWDLNRIAELWDSIYHGYPIGQLLFWETESEISTYDFFDDNLEAPFLFENKRPKWRHTKKVSSTGKTIVLDGQQRLTSLFLGSRREGVSTKIRRNSSIIKAKVLCIYIGKEDADGDNEIKLFDWKDQDDIPEDYLPVYEALNSRSSKNLYIRILKNRIFNQRHYAHRVDDQDSAVSVSYVKNDDMISVVEIFRRLNNNGRPMTKSELFLAMLFGSSEARDLKDDIAGLATAYGEDFDVKDSTITQLLVTVFGLDGAKLSNLENVSDKIAKLKIAAKKTLEFLHKDCGIYSNSEMISHNLFIPLTYTFYKFPNPSDKLRQELRCFTFRALIFGLFSKSTDFIVASIKKSIDNMKGDNFIESLDKEKVKSICFGDLISGSEWINSRIEEILSLEKGPRTKLILLLLKESAADIDGENYDQDHLVAADLFKEDTDIVALIHDGNNKFGTRLETSEEAKLTEEDLKKWPRVKKYMAARCNTLPNLWLLEQSRNREKGKILLSIWYDAVLNDTEKADFWAETMLPKKSVAYLKISNFEELYNKRREVLERKLKEILKIPR